MAPWPLHLACPARGIKRRSVQSWGHGGRLEQEGSVLPAIHMFPSRRSVSVHSRPAPRGKYPLVWNLRDGAEGFPFLFFFFFVDAEPCALPSPLLFPPSSPLSSPLLPAGFQGPGGGAEATQRSLSPSVHPVRRRLKRDTQRARAKPLFYRGPLGSGCFAGCHPSAAVSGISATLCTVKQQRGGVGG